MTTVDPVQRLNSALARWEPPGTTFTVAIVDAARALLDALPDMLKAAEERGYRQEERDTRDAFIAGQWRSDHWNNATGAQQNDN